MVGKEGLLTSVSFIRLSYFFWLRFPKLWENVGPLSLLKLRNLITKPPRQMWKLWPKYIICNSTCFTAFSKKWMKTQNETSHVIFFACRHEQGSCLSCQCCGFTCVFQLKCWHIHYDQKGKCWLWTDCLIESDLTMACFLSKYTLLECYYACYKVNELHFLTTIAIRLTRTAGKPNQQVQSTTDRSKINFLLNSPLLKTIMSIQHLSYLFPVQYKRKHIQNTIRCSQENLL